MTFLAVIHLSCECGCGENTTHHYTVEGEDEDEAATSLEVFSNDVTSPKKCWPEASRPVIDDFAIVYPEKSPPLPT